MGRHLVGTGGFVYKYELGEQDDNLRQLAESGFGSGGIVPCFVGGATHVVSIPCMGLSRRIVTETGAVGVVRQAIAMGDVYGGPNMRLVQDAMMDHLHLVAAYLDEALPDDYGAGEPLQLVSFQSYALDRDGWLGMLEYVHTALPQTPLRPGDLNDVRVVDRAMSLLKEKRAWLPAMGLAILQHAVARNLDRIEVREQSPSAGVDDFWQVAASNIGSEASEEDDVDSLFARGFAQAMAGEEHAAVDSFELAHEKGQPRAKRWLKWLGAEPRNLTPVPLAPRGSVATDPVLVASVARVAEIRRAQRSLPKTEAPFMLRQPERGIELLEALAGEREAVRPDTRFAHTLLFTLLVGNAPRETVEQVIEHMERWYGKLEPDSWEAEDTNDDHTLNDYLGQQPPDALLLAHNLACGLCRLGKLERALHYVACAVALGSDADDLRGDDDLAPLLNLPQFAQILRG